MDVFTHHTMTYPTFFGHSDKLHIVERIRLDPEALEEPYIVHVKYKRGRYGDIIKFQYAENNCNPIDAEGNTLFN